MFRRTSIRSMGLVTTQGGMRRILKKTTRIDKYIRQAVESGVYRENGKTKQQQRSSMRRNVRWGTSIQDYPPEYQILSMNPPLPEPPRIPKKDIQRERMWAEQHRRELLKKQRGRDGVASAAHGDAHGNGNGNAHGNSIQEMGEIEETRRLVKAFLERYEDRQKLRLRREQRRVANNLLHKTASSSSSSSSSVVAEGDEEASLGEYYERILGIPPPTIDEMATSHLGSKSVLLNKAHIFAMKQREILRRENTGGHHHRNWQHHHQDGANDETSGRTRGTRTMTEAESARIVEAMLREDERRERHQSRRTSEALQEWRKDRDSERNTNNTKTNTNTNRNQNRNDTEQNRPHMLEGRGGIGDGTVAGIGTTTPPPSLRFSNPSTTAAAAATTAGSSSSSTSSVPSILTDKPRTLQAMALWSNRLSIVPYREWTVGATVALDHWIARSILDWSEETWEEVLENDTTPSSSASSSHHNKNISKFRDVVMARRALFPETSSMKRHDEDDDDEDDDEDDDDESMAAEEDDGDHDGVSRTRGYHRHRQDGSYDDGGGGEYHQDWEEDQRRQRRATTTTTTATSMSSAADKSIDELLASLGADLGVDDDHNDNNNNNNNNNNTVENDSSSSSSTAPWWKKGDDEITSSSSSSSSSYSGTASSSSSSSSSTGSTTRKTTADEQVERLVEQLQHWRAKHHEIPYDRWNSDEKGQFQDWLNHYVELLADPDEQVDMNATREALLDAPPMTKSESNDFWKRIQDETDAEIWLDAIQNERRRTKKEKKEQRTKGDVVDEEDDDDEPEESRLFWTALTHEERVRRLVDLGSIRPALDEYVTETARNDFFRRHGSKLLEGVSMEHLVPDPEDGPVRLDRDLDVRTRRQLGLLDGGADGGASSSPQRFAVKRIPYGVDEYGMDASQRARRLYRLWNTHRAGRARYEEVMFKRGRLGLRYDDNDDDKDKKDDDGGGRGTTVANANAGGKKKKKRKEG